MDSMTLLLLCVAFVMGSANTLLFLGLVIYVRMSVSIHDELSESPEKTLP